MAGDGLAVHLPDAGVEGLGGNLGEARAVQDGVGLQGQRLQGGRAGQKVRHVLARHVPACQVQGLELAVAAEGAGEGGDLGRVDVPGVGRAGGVARSVRHGDGGQAGRALEHALERACLGEVQGGGPRLVHGGHVLKGGVALEPAGGVLDAHPALEDHVLHELGIAPHLAVGGGQGQPGQVVRVLRHQDVLPRALGAVVADRQGVGGRVVGPPDVLVGEATA